tara:strand:- start:676 stop:1668 length:993 start_codon:yes stop_codon:yes gene_type:complete
MNLFKLFWALLVPFQFYVDGNSDGGGSSDDSSDSGDSTDSAAGDVNPETVTNDNDVEVGNSAASGSARDFIDSHGNFKQGWTEALGLPKSLEKFQSFEGAMGSYTNMEAMLGKTNKVVVPGAESTPEEIALFNEKMGVPSDSKGYEFKKPEAVPDELWSTEEVGAYAELAHKVGLTPKQAQDIADWQAGRATAAHGQMVDQITTSRDQASAALKSEWGADYADNVAKSERGAALFGLNAEYLASHPEISNDPVMIKGFAAMAGMVKEAKTVNIRTTGGHMAINTPAQAKEEISRIMNDPTHAYNSGKANSAHDNAVALVASLHEMVSPEQ